MNTSKRGKRDSRAKSEISLEDQINGYKAWIDSALIAGDVEIVNAAFQHAQAEMKKMLTEKELKIENKEVQEINPNVIEKKSTSQDKKLLFDFDSYLANVPARINQIKEEKSKMVQVAKMMEGCKNCMGSLEKELRKAFEKWNKQFYREHKNKKIGDIIKEYSENKDIEGGIVASKDFLKQMQKNKMLSMALNNYLEIKQLHDALATGANADKKIEAYKSVLYDRPKNGGPLFDKLATSDKPEMQALVARNREFMKAVSLPKTSQTKPKENLDKAVAPTPQINVSRGPGRG